MRVLVMLLRREPPSSRLRFRGCGEELLKNGIEPVFRSIPSDPVGRWKLIFEVGRYDALIIQKKTSFRAFELAIMRRLNPNIIFDYDDAVMFHELENGEPLSGKNFLKFLKTLRYCKAVVAGNVFLAGFARPNCSRVYILPTPIDIGRYSMKSHSRINGEVVIGWIGVSGNLKYLKGIERPLREIARRYREVVLKIISNDEIVIDGIRTIFKKWRLEEEAKDLNSIDIGVMPLDDSLWAMGKCGYKILQYMAAGVPVVASPVGINSEIVREGETGFLASTDEEWERCLYLLISNPEKREAMGRLGRKRVEESYSLSRYAMEYSKIIREIVK